MNFKNDLFLFGIFAFLISLQGCVAYKPFPVGQIPAPVMPSASAIANTARAVEQNVTKEGGRIISSGPRYDELNRIWTRLLIASGANPNWFPIVIVDHPTQVNAAMVNGSLAQVYSKLLDRCHNPYDIVTILSHEFAHALLNHHLNESDLERNRAGAQIFGAVLGGVVGALQSGSGADPASANDTAQTFSQLGTSIAHGAGALRYGRDQEYDADKVGMMIMAKACYDPEQALIFWRDRSDRVLENSRGISSFFSTHPFNSERAESLVESLPAAKTFYENNCKRN